MECTDLDYITFTNIQKLHSSLLNSKVSKNIRNQGETLFCWAFSISTMIRQSLNLFIADLKNLESSDKSYWMLPGTQDEVLEKLNGNEFHRQLRNELIMIPIPKFFSNEHNDFAPLSQGHYLDMALERVSYK